MRVDGINTFGVSAGRLASFRVLEFRISAAHGDFGAARQQVDRVGQDAETRPAAASSSLSAGSIASASSSMSLAISGVVTKPKSTIPL